MKCPNCGNEVNEQDKVCPSCQVPLQGEAGSVTEAPGEEAAEEKSVEEAEEPAGETVAEEAEDSAGETVAEEAEEPAGETVAEEAEEPAPAKKGKKAIIAGIVAVVAAAGIFGAVKMREKDPKEAVIDAFKSVTESEVKPMDELFGYSQFVENAKTANLETGLSLSLDGGSSDWMNQYSGSGFRMDEKLDQENDKLSLDICGVYNSMDLVSLKMYYGDETLMLAVPELLNTVFTADLGDGLADRLMESPTFGPQLKAQGVDVEELEKCIRDYMDMAENGGESNSYDLEGLYNRYKEGCKAQENFKAAMTVEKGEKGQFEMDGQQVTCKGYQVHISKDSMIDFLRTSSDFFLKDEDFKKAYLENLELSVRLSSIMGAGTDMPSAKELQEETYEEASKQVQEVISQLDQSLQDVDMTVYVDKKGRLAAVSGSTALVREDSTTVDLTFDTKLKGGAWLLQNWETSATVGSGNDQNTITWTKTGSYDGTQITSEHQIVFDETKQDAHLLELDASMQYTADGGDYQIGLDVKGSGVPLGSFRVSGIVDELEKGSAFHCTMDEIVTKIESEGFELKLSGDYYYRPLSGEITEPQGQKLDVFAADEEDWENVAMQAYFGLTGLIGQLDLDM